MKSRLSQLHNHLGREREPLNQQHALFEWMDKKVLGLRQDIFILGPPGRAKLEAVMKYLESRQLPFEYVCLSNDIGESDLLLLKQLRSQTVYFQHQRVVRAALAGNILILDGVEKAERNTLPVINNILENREMSLEDGSMLIRWERYQSLLAAGHGENELRQKHRLLPCRPEFCIIALGVPVPQFPGYPLDPPLRSRFQCFAMADTLESDSIPLNGKIVSVCRVLASLSFQKSIPHFSLDKLSTMRPIFDMFKDLTVASLLQYLYPFLEIPSVHELVLQTLKQFELEPSDPISADTQSQHKSVLPDEWSPSIPSVMHATALDAFRLIITRVSFILLGRAGSGKSHLIRQLLVSSHRAYRLIPLHRELSAKDLLQRRITLRNGDTAWQDSELIKAALSGETAVLDGAEQMRPDVLPSLQSLFVCGKLFLPDGTELCSSGQSSRRISPQFQIIVVGTIDQMEEQSKWLTPEISSLLPFVYMPSGNLMEIAKEIFPNSTLLLSNLARLAASDTDKTVRRSVDRSLNLRSLQRLIHHSSTAGKPIRREVERMVLLPFLSPAVRLAVGNLLDGIDMHFHDITDPIVSSQVGNDYWQIGNNCYQRYQPKDLTLVPRVQFRENPGQLRVIAEIVRDLMEFHLPVLLIGNQGVGKNKIADYILQCLRRPRHYLQLHRDSSIYSLTQRTVLVDGQLRHEISPLVESIQQGTVLMIDEADKAPTEVTAVLKSLIADGEMLLPDGRRIKHPALKTTNAYEKLNDQNTIWIHPDFRIIVLANRPGYPFLGNDFYKSLGYCFSAHVVDNPDSESEVVLLQQYGPSVGQHLLRLLSSAFSELRASVNEGRLLYPYSTRELANIVRHLESFPADGISGALCNVFNFDAYDDSLKDDLREIFWRHGIPLLFSNDSVKFRVVLSPPLPLPPPQLAEVWSVQNSEEIHRQSIDKPLVIKGSWKSRATRSIHLLKTSTLRMMQVFSEIKAEYKLPVTVKSTTISCTFTCGAQIISLATEPACLVIWEFGTHQVISIDIDEYLPGAQRMQAGSVLFNGKPCVAIVAQDSIYVFNLADNSVFSLALPEEMMNNLIECEFRQSFIFMWKGDKIIAMDLSADGRQKIIQLPFIVDSISWTGEGEVLICTSTNGHEIWSLRFNLPAYSLQRIHLKSSSSWRLNSLHFSALTLSKTCLMSDAKSLADSFLLSLRNQELWRYPRGDSAVPNPHFRPAFLFHSPNTMITVFDGGSSSNGKVLGLVEIIDLSKCTVKTILMELAEPKNATMKLCCLISLDSDAVLLVDSGGFAWHIQVSQSSLESRFETWKMMIGTNNIISKSGDGNEEIGFGGGGDDDESDGNNGNSQYPGIRLVTKFYGARKLRKVDLDRMTLRTEAAPTKITNEALQMRDMALKQRLGQLGLSQTEGIDFNDRLQRTERFIREIRSTLLQTESRTKERQWLSMQTSGELDEKRLVESLTGQQNIYRRRAEVEPISGGPLSRPKIIWFCFDVSASMTRFQPHDQRLDRSMDVALMLCESFRPFQHKIRVQLSGHSGDSHFIQLAAEGRLPAEGRETWRLLETMKELSAHCVSGDTTLRAVEYAVANITKQPEEADEYLVVILSDANLAQYSIQPDQLTRALRADHPRVHASIVFIGSLLDQAERLMNELPAGHCFMCMQPGDLPRIVKNLLLS